MEKDHMTYTEAIEKYERSRSYIEKLCRTGEVRRRRNPTDARQVLLSAYDLEVHFAPKRVLFA